MQHPRDVLALCDLSPAATNAAWRAALVARDHGVSLRLLHAQPDPAAVQAAQVALDGLAAELQLRLGIDVLAQAVAGDPLHAAADAARDCGLLVLGSRRGNPLRELMFGTQAERLIRLCRIPVLVVKRPATAAYRRVLVPVDLGPLAAEVIAAATRFSRDPRMEVLHALGTRDEVTLRVADVPERVLRSYRNRAAQKARKLLEELIAYAGAGDQGALPLVGFGDAAHVVLSRAQAMRAELVVIGKRRRGLLAEFFLGGVTQRVLAATRSDVLVPSPQGADRNTPATKGMGTRHDAGLITGKEAISWT